MLIRILSWQSKFNKFLQVYLLAPTDVPHFSTKKGSVIILKMTNFWRKNLAIFHKVKKIEIYCIYNTFASYKECVLQEYIEMESKIFSIIFEGFLK